MYENGTENPEVMLESPFQFEVWEVEYNLIPHVQQLVLSDVSIKGLIINTYLYDFFDGPGEVV